MGAGNSETAVYALTSSAGTLLLDAGFENKAEALVAQLQKLNLDPASVKYILLGHEHADHFGAAGTLSQSRCRHAGAHDGCDGSSVLHQAMGK